MAVYPIVPMLTFPKSDLIENGCTCPAAGKYWGLCKHMVALLLPLWNMTEGAALRLP